MPRKKRDNGRYIVRDGIRLKRLVGRLVEATRQGSLNAAAAHLGISQPTLWRLSEGNANQVESVSRDTISKLEQGALKVSRRLQTELMLCMMSPGAFRLYRDGYVAWCEERQKRLLNRRGINWCRLTGQAPQSTKQLRFYRQAPLSSDLDGAIAGAKSEFPDIFERLRKIIVTKGYPPQRFMVGVVRMVEPLAELAASGFFEPKWNELSKRDRRSFLLHGLAIERMLLNREDNPHALANQLARGDSLPAARQPAAE